MAQRKNLIVRPNHTLIKAAPAFPIKAGGKPFVPPGSPGREKMGQNLSPDIIDRVVADMKSSFFRPSGTEMGPQKPGWFDPMTPMPPVAQESSYGRQFDFRAGYNLNIIPRPDEAISFAQLRSLADTFDILRLVMETRKDQIEQFQWKIKPTEDFEEDATAKADAERATEFMQEPDRQNVFSSWLRMILEDLFVLDAVCILPRKTRGGKLWGFELIDGGTIMKKIDNTGRTPLPPDVAYQSWLHGVPAASYTQDDLRYYMRNPRTWKVYGYSPVEQVIMTVNIALRRQFSQLQYYTEGNIPEAIAGVPESWSVEQIAQFQAYWDSMLEGNTAERRHMKFVPIDPNNILMTKDGEQVLKDEYDEWLTRIICFAFSIAPTPFIKQMNRSVADNSKQQSKEEGLLPLLTWLGKILTRLLTKDLGVKNVEFKWDLDEKVAPEIQANIHKIYVSCGVMTTDEVRDDLGMEPMTDEQKKELYPPPAGPGQTAEVVAEQEAEAADKQAKASVEAAKHGAAAGGGGSPFGGKPGGGKPGAPGGGKPPVLQIQHSVTPPGGPQSPSASAKKSDNPQGVDQ